MKTFFNWLFLLLLVFCPHLQATDRTFFAGTIQFPASLETVPDIRFYYAGDIVRGVEVDQDNKKIVFLVPEQKTRTFFYLLITPDFDYVSEENTIKYLKLKKGLVHTLYALELITVEEPAPATKRTKNGAPEKVIRHYWSIKPLSLTLPSGRIPDDAIIVRYNPDWVQDLGGGSKLEFPKIIIKPDVVTLAGSEKKFHDLSRQWFMSSLNTDTFHGCPQVAVTFLPEAKKRILLPEVA